MIHTIYCNVYEGLEAALVENIYQELKVLPQTPESIFRKIEIIPASAAIQDRLSRSLSDKFSILPGIQFCSIFDWLKPYLGATFRPSSIGTSLDWQIWGVLKDPNFFEDLKKEVPEESFNRLSSFLLRPEVSKSLNEIQLIEFCYALSTLFATYGSYRMDWLLNWIDPKLFVLPADKIQVMEAHPDYHWQKFLWQTIAKQAKTRDLKNLKEIPSVIRNFKFTEQDKGKSLHFFMPFSLPPILLPFLKAFAEDENAPDLWLYIMNPCAEYWFESVPRDLFDWSSNFDLPAQNFLSQSSPSTRAMIDRLYRFLNVDDNETIETDAKTNGKLKAPKKTNIKRKKNSISDLRANLEALSPDQRLFEPEDVQAYYFQQPQDSYLHKFQNSVLFLDSERLPDKADPEDESLKVLKAPSFPREIEGIVDWLHYRLSNDKQLKLSDIAVIVPDVEKATPAIEAVMNGLPDELRLPYKIIGNSIADTYLTVAAILGLGKLLNSRFDAKKLEEWLELPINLERWKLSLSDISVLSNWLKTAGFRYGLSDDHLTALGQDLTDGTLDRAIERLTLGYFINPIEKSNFGDVLPVFGDELSGFDLVTDGRGALFKTLSALSEALEESRKELYAFDGMRTPVEWQSLISEWLDRFFMTRNSAQEVLTFRTALTRLSGAMQEGLNPDVKVPFDVIWNVIETHLKETPSPSQPNGSITFGSVSYLRGLPYKAIALAGFDELSRFPGNTSHQEFDLMGVDQLKRRADRDSRDDNKARFLDCMLAARKYLVMSYTVGTDPVNEANPSPVIQNFKNYFLHTALQNYGKEAAKELWNTIEAKLPLNSFSEMNFRKQGARVWLSPNEMTLQSVRKAYSENYSLPEKPIAGHPIPDTHLNFLITEKGILPAQELIKFLTGPVDYVLKKHKLETDFSVSEQEFAWLAPDDPLATSQRKRNFTKLIEKGYESNQIYEQIQLNPLYGIEDIRLSSVIKNYEDAEKANALCQKLICELHLSAAHETVEVRYTPSIGKISAVRDNSSGIYTDGKGRYVIFNNGFSKSEETRSYLRSYIWQAAGKPTMVINLAELNLEVEREALYRYFQTDVSPEEESNSEFYKDHVKELIRLYNLNRQYTIGYFGNIGREGLNPLLNRGFDLEDAIYTSKQICSQLVPETGTSKGASLPENVDYLTELIQKEVERKVKHD